MGATKSKWVGQAEKLAGKAIEKIGQKMDDPELEAQGRGKRKEGEVRSEIAKAALRAQGAVDKVVGSVKQQVGKAVGSKKLEVKGKTQSLKGQTTQQTNR